MDLAINPVHLGLQVVRNRLLGRRNTVVRIRSDPIPSYPFTIRTSTEMNRYHVEYLKDPITGDHTSMILRTRCDPEAAERLVDG
jgi:hypothetical protein